MGAGEYEMKTQIMKRTLHLLWVFILAGCASTDELYAEYEHQCRVSIVANASGTVVVEESSGKQLLWEQAVYFNYDVDSLQEMERQRIKTNVAVLNTYPELNINVRGFTDSIASQQYNLDLAQRRVAFVIQLLIDSGIAASRIYEAPLGESLPLAENDSYLNRSINRRVELLLLDQDGRPAPIRLVDKSDHWDTPSNISPLGTEKDWRR